MSGEPLKTEGALGPRQFTLQRLLLASTFVSFVCAVVGWDCRVFASYASAENKTAALVVSMPIICVLLGAACGALVGKTVKWVRTIVLTMVFLAIAFSLIAGAWELLSGAFWHRFMTAP